MTTQKAFKRRVRERMTKTGERYSAARQHIVVGKERLEGARARLESAKELASDERLIEATGRDWAAWLTILDGWGGRDHTHQEIVAFLSDEHRVPGWWRQTITNGYERARGMRAKHQQADGFTVYASKTVGAALEELFAAFVDESRRRDWLTDGEMSLRNAQTGKVARFNWEAGTSRILVTFEAKGPMKATVHVAHERLPDAAAGEEAKVAWKSRLAALKATLE